MKILVVGSGGREHAICWKLKQSAQVEKLWCAPGNAGIASVAECVDIGVEDLEKLADFCERHDLILCSDEIHCDLVLDEDKKHVCALTLPERIQQRTVMLSAPSKTFNIAGILYVAPYYTATMAEFYISVRSEAFAKGITSRKELPFHFT